MASIGYIRGLSEGKTIYTFDNVSPSLSFDYEALSHSRPLMFSDIYPGTSALYNNKIYYMRYQEQKMELVSYDLMTNSWGKKEVNIIQQPSWGNLFVFNNTLYCFLDLRFYSVDPDSGVITLVKQLNYVSSLYLSFYCEGKLYYLAKYDSGKTEEEQAYGSAYDIITDTYTTLSPIHVDTSAVNHALIFNNNKLYLLPTELEYSAPRQYLCYDIETDTSSFQEMPAMSLYYVTWVNFRNVFYFIGGATTNISSDRRRDGAVNTVYSYNPETNTLSYVCRTSFYGGLYHVSHVSEEGIYLYGGNDLYYYYKSGSSYCRNDFYDQMKFVRPYKFLTFDIYPGNKFQFDKEILLNGELIPANTEMTVDTQKTIVLTKNNTSGTVETSGKTIITN